MANFNQEKLRLLYTKAKSGDEKSIEDLFEFFKPMVNSIARRYFLIGGDEQDLIQEGMIGLYKAFQNYDLNSNASFATFAYLCVKRQVLTAVRSDNSQKNLPLQSYISINSQGGLVLEQLTDDEEDEEAIILECDNFNFENVIFDKEKEYELQTKIKNSLSEFEYKVILGYLQGYSYKELAKMLDKTEKSIDNAIVRIKNKLNFLK